MLSPVVTLDLCPVVGWFVVLLVVGLITQNLGWRTGLSLEKTPFTFGVEPNKGTDRGLFFSLSLTLMFFPHFVHFSGSNG